MAGPTVTVSACVSGAVVYSFCQRLASMRGCHGLVALGKSRLGRVSRRRMG